MLKFQGIMLPKMLEIVKILQTEIKIIRCIVSKRMRHVLTMKVSTILNVR